MRVYNNPVRNRQQQGIRILPYKCIENFNIWLDVTYIDISFEYIMLFCFIDNPINQLKNVALFVITNLKVT